MTSLIGNINNAMLKKIIYFYSHMRIFGPIMDIYALKGEVWAHKSNLTSPVFIEVPDQDNEPSCIDVLRLQIPLFL